MSDNEVVQFELNPQYKLSNDWYRQLTYSAAIVYNNQVGPAFKFDPTKKRTILEIGVFEGASTCWWSDNLLDHPESQIYSIDPFTGSEEHHVLPSYGSILSSLEMTARSNIAKSKNASKINLIKGCSWDVFPTLQQFLNQKIDILYIDGAHDANSICRDTSLYYPLLKQHGVIIWDDYANAECARAIDGCVSIFCNLQQRATLHGQLWGIKT